MSDEWRSNLTSSKHWVRLVYMLLFAFFLYIVLFVAAGLVVAQFLIALFSGEDNKKLRAFGSSIALYVKDVTMFLTFNTEHKAFPFSDWPDAVVPAHNDIYDTDEVTDSNDEPPAEPSTSSIADAEIVADADPTAAATKESEDNTVEVISASDSDSDHESQAGKTVVGEGSAKGSEENSEADVKANSKLSPVEPVDSTTDETEGEGTTAKETDQKESETSKASANSATREETTETK